MKKNRIVLFVLSLLFATCPAFARFTIGPKVGVNVSDVYYNISILNDEIRFRHGVNVGIFGNYRLRERLDLQAEVSYSQQGYKNVIPITDVGGTVIPGGYKLLTHYLNLPALVRFYPVKRIYLEAGPQIGFRLGHKYYSGEMEWRDIDRERGDGRVDFSFVGGVGILLGKGFSVDARYCYGLPVKSRVEGLDYGNRVIRFSVAYDLWSF